jgi:hypothetical protein
MNDDMIDEARLRKLRDDVAALPRSIEPPADAWTNIRSAIEAEQKPDIGAPGGEDPPAVTGSKRSYLASRVWWQRPSFLAAAALLLVAGSSAVTAVALRSSRDQNASVGTSQVAGRSPEPTASSGGPASLAQFTVVESDYLRAVNDLTATLDSEHGSLSPETIAKLRESLKIIDAAILEARNALAADPANRTLIRMLSTSYEQKVDLLKRTTEMARS